MRIRILITLSLLLILLSSQVKPQIYVSPQGSDSNPGTGVLPFLTLTKAISVAVQGSTIYVHGGTYLIDSTIYINSDQSGTDSSMHYLFAFPGERPKLDFSGTESGERGISLRASYWHIKGFDIYGAGDNGMEINGGSNNIIEFCSFYENEDTGLQLSNGASDNKIINCDSYYNADPPDYADADGFAPKLTCGSGNYFYGCRAWANVDDGWDGYLRGADSITTTLENCWTWGNGYRKDGSNPGSQANGNGFKMGGGDNSNSQKLMHHFILTNCLAFNNKSKGFDQNNNAGSMTLLNCTGYNNYTANYKVTQALNPGQTLTVKNSVVHRGTVELGSFAIQQTNSWMSPFVVTADDFLSTDTASVSAPRKEDGSLPDIAFMHLAPGSDLIDAGTDIGLPFNGKAPDLGAFETEAVTLVENEIKQEGFRLEQNYPNPFNPVTTIKFTVGTHHSTVGTRRGVFVQLCVYDVLGNEVATLVNEEKAPGYYQVKFDGSNLSSGIYFYRIKAGEFTATKKLLLQK